MGALIQVTAWEHVSLGRRLLGAVVRVAILFAVLISLINLIGPRITIFYMTRLVARKSPAVKVTPLPLSNYSVSDEPGTTLSYFGYTFDVPWKGNFKQKAFEKNGLVQLDFDSGQNLTFIVPANQDGLLVELAQDKSLHMESLQIIFADLLHRSAYDQYAALLNATPAGVKAFGPGARAVQEVTLLTIKSIAVGPGLKTGAFSFDLPDKRGFQIGDPAQSKRVDSEIFGFGNHYVEIICVATKDTFKLTQPQINRILESLHTVSAPVSAIHPTN
jgi:hypothetical protein